MRQLNIVGAELAEFGLIRAAVDVTGFGLLGHLPRCVALVASAQKSFPAKVPVISREVLALIAQDCVPGGTKTKSRNSKCHCGMEQHS